MFQPEVGREDQDYSLDYSYTDLQSSMAQPDLDNTNLITVTTKSRMHYYQGGEEGTSHGWRASRVPRMPAR